MEHQGQQFTTLEALLAQWFHKCVKKRVFFIFFSQIKLCFPKKELEADRQKSTMSCQAMEKSGVGEMVAIFKDMRTGMTILSLLYY